MLAHGFTIKEGESDLKAYVYEAAYALIGEVSKKPQSLQAWYEGLQDLEKFKLMECVNDNEGKWPKGMGSIFWRGMTIKKRQFDWVRRNVTG